MECPSSKMIVTVDNEGGGDGLQSLLNDIAGVSEQLGQVELLHSMPGYLGETTAAAEMARSGPYALARFAIPFGNDFAFASLIDKAFGNGSGKKRVLAVEPDHEFDLNSALGYDFRRGGNDADYRTMMGVDVAHAAQVQGQGIRVAIIDSGCEQQHRASLASEWDATQAPNLRPALEDANGHGSAMIQLVRSIAPQAEIHSVKVCEPNKKLSIFNVMAALYVAAADIEADIISMSLGFSKMHLLCKNCGGTAQSRSFAFQRVTEAVAYHKVRQGRSPILLAATGNNGKDDLIHSPANYDRVVSIGSVDLSGHSSDFSNYVKGDQQFRHFVLPGGQADPDGSNVREDVGSSFVTGNQCFGTSPATAYGAGLLALLWSDTRYSRLSRDPFLDALEAKHCRQSSGYSRDAYGSGQLYWAPPKSKTIAITGGGSGQPEIVIRFEDDGLWVGDTWLDVEL